MAPPKTLSELLDRARAAGPARLAVPAAESGTALEAVVEARRRGLARAVLFGDRDGLAADGAWIVESGNESSVRVQIHEGRKRIVRRMFQALGMPVIALSRESIGPLALGGMAEGMYRRLSPEEVAMLYACAGTTRHVRPQEAGQ